MAKTAEGFETVVIDLLPPAEHRCRVPAHFHELHPENISMM